MGTPSAFHRLFVSRNPLYCQDLHLSNPKFVFPARTGHVDPQFKSEFEVLGRTVSTEDAFLRGLGAVLEVRGTWRSISRRCAGGKLTCTSDKLVALSGLALLTRAKEEEYVTGMWKRDVLPRFPGYKLYEVSLSLSDVSDRWWRRSAVAPSLWAVGRRG
jgi:hypothetical protein